MAADRSTADRSTAELERFLAERADHLLRTAALLTGSREAGEDCCRLRSSGCCGAGAGSTGIPRATCAGHCATWRSTAADGAVGVILGAISTAVYAHVKGWAIVIPPAALLIGALAGLLPAIRASGLSPTQALWTL
jgi:hypothetical protein